MKKMLLTALLLSMASMSSAQTSIMNIPALPPGRTAPTTATPAVTTPAVTAPATSSTVTTTPAPATPAAPSSDLPTVTTLPAKGTALAIAHAATLEGPATVTAGEANTWDFNLTNNGTQAIKLQHGACDVRFEVLNEAGEVVRPDPQNGICTMQMVYTDIAPGETKTVQKIRWEGKDGSGQPVPAGVYTIRAKFNGGNVFSEPATLEVTVQ